MGYIGYIGYMGVSPGHCGLVGKGALLACDVEEASLGDRDPGGCSARWGVGVQRVPGA